MSCDYFVNRFNAFLLICRFLSVFLSITFSLALFVHLTVLELSTNLYAFNELVIHLTLNCIGHLIQELIDLNRLICIMLFAFNLNGISNFLIFCRSISFILFSVFFLKKKPLFISSIGLNTLTFRNEREKPMLLIAHYLKFHQSQSNPFNMAFWKIWPLFLQFMLFKMLPLICE